MTKCKTIKGRPRAVFLPFCKHLPSISNSQILPFATRQHITSRSKPSAEQSITRNHNLSLLPQLPAPSRSTTTFKMQFPLSIIALLSTITIVSAQSDAASSYAASLATLEQSALEFVATATDSAAVSSVEASLAAVGSGFTSVANPAELSQYNYAKTALPTIIPTDAAGASSFVAAFSSVAAHASMTGAAASGMGSGNAAPRITGLPHAAAGAAIVGLAGAVAWL